MAVEAISFHELTGYQTTIAEDCGNSVAEASELPRSCYKASMDKQLGL